MDTPATGEGGNSGDRYRTLRSQSSTSSYASQYPAYGGLGSDTAAQSTPLARGGGSVLAYRNNYTPPPPAPTFSTVVPDLGALTAQLAQALSAIQTLTQESGTGPAESRHRTAIKGHAVTDAEAAGGAEAGDR